MDFVCFEKKLIVEVDGGQHLDDRIEDDKRTAWLAARGFHVLRFWNHDVLSDVNAVLTVINEALRAQPCPPTQPSPTRGEGIKRQNSLARGEGMKRQNSLARGEGMKR